MLRVMRNHQRAARGETTGYEGLSVPPVPLSLHAQLLDQRLHQAAVAAWDGWWTWGIHGYRNAQVTAIAPPEPSGLLMGLRYHRN